MKIKKDFFQLLLFANLNKENLISEILLQLGALNKLEQLIRIMSRSPGGKLKKSYFIFSSYSPLHFFELFSYANLDIENV